MAEHFDGLRSDYAAAKSSRFRRRRTGYSSSGSGADFHYHSEVDYLKILEYARDFDRNDCIVGQTIDRARSNIVQDGFSLDARTGDPEIDRELTARWLDWAGDPDQCDLAGEATFWDHEETAMRAAMVDGDAFFLPWKTGELYGIESHRCRTPRNTKRNVIHGVLLGERRRRLEYWFTKDDVDPMRAVSKVSEIRPVAARDGDGFRQVFHVYNPKRISQTRGISAFAPIFDLLGMFEDINFAKLVQQQVVSCFAIFRVRELEFRGEGDPQKGERTTETLADGTSRTIEGIAPGMEISGDPGEKLEGFSPNVPNPEFFPHMKLILTLIGVNLGLPLNIVLLDPSETNFSGWRGAVDQARIGFRRNQKWLINRFHSPVYRWKVRQWTAQDASLRTALGKPSINLFGHRWHPPTWPYIEPLKDASADLLRLRNGLTSPRRFFSSKGQDVTEINEEKVADNGQAIRRAKKEAEDINAEFDDGQPVHWREVLSLPTPDGVQVAITTGDDENTEIASDDRAA